MTALAEKAKTAVEAFNSTDWDSVDVIFGKSTYHELGTQRSLHGGEIIEAMRDWKTAMPDVTGTVTNAFERGDQVMLELTWEGNQTGPLATPEGEIPPSGKHQKTPAAWIFEYEGERLKESRHYFDMLTFLQQIGAA